MKMSLLALLMAVAITGAAGDSEAKKQVTCLQVTETFCNTLWMAPHFGNYDLKGKNSVQELRFGRTANDIDEQKLFFFEALKRYAPDLPKDIQDALKKNAFFENLELYLKRKPRAQISAEDMTREEWNGRSITRLEEAMEQVARSRTERDHPGYLKLSTWDTSGELTLAYYKHLDMAWSQLFTAIWIKHPRWLQVQRLFEKIRDEYVVWVTENKDFSPPLKKQFIDNLKTIKLRIPGSNPAKANSTGHWCGIDETNSYYNFVEHELTVCAGEFNSGLPLLSLAHEVGHSIAISRRMIQHFSAHDYGKGMLDLWTRSCEGNHLSCEEWDTFKKYFSKASRDLPTYSYEDAKILERFADKKLTALPQGKELTDLADRLATTTVREDIDDHYLEYIIKREEILLTGRIVPNYRFLKPCALASRWPNPYSVLDKPMNQFEIFFTQAFHCQQEKKVADPAALKAAIEESRDMTALSWATLLRAPGKFSYIQEPRDRGYAQDIEEDLVDSYASIVVGRMLKKEKSLDERRLNFLATMATYCDAPSFLQRYPEEALVLRSFTNKPHSNGLDRRKKILSKEIREALHCQ